MLTVASTGIAALQLTGGGTAYSVFKLPLDDHLKLGAVCNIRTETQRADLIRKYDLNILDGLPMTHSHCAETLDRTLRDILGRDSPFGGKTVLFSGDWRQVGPVVKFGSPADMIDAAVISSFIWPQISRMRLTLSQRNK